MCADTGSSSSTGNAWKLSPLSTGYYRKHFGCDSSRHLADVDCRYHGEPLDQDGAAGSRKYGAGTSIPLLKGLTHFLNFPVRTLDVEIICPGVSSINVPEEALQLFNLLVADVIPHFVRREMRPKIALRSDCRCFS